MRWFEAVFDKPRDIPETVSDSDAYSQERDILPDIYDAPLPEPPEYLSNKVLEPDDTPEKADTYVRFWARR